MTVMESEDFGPFVMQLVALEFAVAKREKGRDSSGLPHVRAGEPCRSCTRRCRLGRLT